MIRMQVFNGVEAQTDIVVMAVRGRSALDLTVFGATTLGSFSWDPARFSPFTFD
jgi:hypothetical protein